MRQAIMCSADMALEGLETTFPDHNGGSDGWDSKHGELLKMLAGLLSAQVANRLNSLQELWRGYRLLGKRSGV